MATFLQLCQAVAVESGTISGTQPTSVTGQTGRLANVVSWTRQANEIIQSRRTDWRWLLADYAGQTVAAVKEYDGPGLGVTTRFGSWVYETETATSGVSIYLTSDGPAEEGWLRPHLWNDFRRMITGSRRTETGKPSDFAIDNQNRMVLYPIPDAAYTILGEYRKAAQSLVANDDIPDMPVEHHDAIKWQALILMGIYDEAVTQLPLWNDLLNRHIEKLEQGFLPRITVSGPLA